MANPFDQFDAPLSPVVPNPIAEANPGVAGPSANPFDRFDAPAAPTGPAAPQAAPRPVQAEPETPAAEDVGLLRRRGQQFAAGASDAFASVPEAKAILDASFDQAVKEQAPERIATALTTLRRASDTLDSGISPMSGGPLDQGERDVLIRQAEEAREAIENWQEMEGAGVMAPEQRGAFQSGESIRKWTADTFGVPDPSDQSFWGKVATGAGQLGAMAATSLVPGVGPAASGVIGMGMGASGAYKEAKEMGADEATALEAARWNTVIGASDMLPIMRAFKALPAPLKGKLTNGLVRAAAKIAEGAGEEAAQEYLSTIAQNLVAQNLYDPNRGLTDGATESALVGAVLGGALSGPAAIGEARGGAERGAQGPGAPGAPDAAPTQGPAPAGSVAPAQPTYEQKQARDAAEDAQLAQRQTQLEAEIDAAEQGGADPTLLRDELSRLTTRRGDLKSPIDTDTIARGRDILDRAARGEPIPELARPSVDETPVGPPPLAEVDPDDAAILMGAGYDAEQILDMAPEERAAELAEARDAGVEALDQTEATRRLIDTRTRIEQRRAAEDAVISGGARNAPKNITENIPSPPSGGNLSSIPVEKINTEAVPEPSTAGGAPVDPVGAVDDTSPPNPFDQFDPQNSGAESPDAQTATPGPNPEADPDIVSLDPSRIKADPQRFQFKSGGDAQGVTDTLRGTKKWDPNASGVAVVWEDNAGERFIVDGHQRLGLAQRLQAEGQNPRIRAIMLREKDGITAEEAMFSGAMKNLQEGGESTSAIDVAKVFRRGGDTVAVQERIPPNRAAYKDGLALSKLEEGPFNLVVNERIPAPIAAEVGRSIEGESAQIAAMDYLIKNPPQNAAQARMVVGQMKADGFATETQGGLFGDTEVATPLFTERARILDNSAKHLRALGKVFKTAIDSEGVLTDAGNVLSSEANQKGLSENARLAVALERLSQRKGPVSDALSAQARRLAAGEISVGQARQEFLEAVRDPDAGAGRPVDGPRPAGDQDAGRAPEVAAETSAQVNPGARPGVEGAEGKPSAPADSKDPRRGRATVARETASWVIRDKATGEAIRETSDRSVADKVNTEKFEAVPVEQHLADLNNPETKAYAYSRRDADPKREAMRAEAAKSRARSPKKKAAPAPGSDQEWWTERDTAQRRELADQAGLSPQDASAAARGRDWDALPEASRAAILRQAGRAEQERQRTGTTEGGSVDQTAEGEQLVIPGAEQITDRERAERAMDRPKRGGDKAPPAGGLFDEDAKNQGSLLSPLDAAAAEADPNPTEAQAEAGNYRMGHIDVQGLDITIETAKGNTRPGRSQPIIAHYGYIRGTKARDGDQIDVYVGNNPDSDAVFVIDQYDPKTGRFDEHKVVLGSKKLMAAEDIYDAGFADGSGPDRRRAITRMTMAEFKEWLAEGDASQPAALHVFPGRVQGKVEADRQRDAAIAKKRTDEIVKEKMRTPVVRNYPDVGARLEITPEFAELYGQIRDAFQRRLKAMNLDWMNAQVVDLARIDDFDAGGYYDFTRDLIVVTSRLAPEIPDFRSARDRTRIFYHEAMHGLRMANLFTDQEWAALSAAAQADPAIREFAEMYRKANPEYFAENPNMLEEEAVVEYLAQRFRDIPTPTQGPAPKTALGRALGKIKALVTAMRGALRARGISKAERVIRAIESGEIGRRYDPENTSRVHANSRDAGAAAARMRMAPAGDTSTPAFRRWFGASKVVNAAGKPLVVYHGTDADFEVFGNAGGRHDTEAAREGFFLSSSPRVASNYADPSRIFRNRETPEGAQVVPAYVSLQNPLELDSGTAAPESMVDGDRGATIRQAKADGHDGMIIRRRAGDEYDSELVVAFRPEQIKSVFNGGAFDPNDRRLLAAPADEDVDLTRGGGSKELKVGKSTITYGISRDGETGEVILVSTPPKARREGQARAAMQKLLAATDRAGITMFLTPDPMGTGGASKTALERFYRSLGFVPNTGRAKDFRSRAAMVRNPSDRRILTAPTAAFSQDARDRVEQANAASGYVAPPKPNPTPSSFATPKRTAWRWVVEQLDDRFDSLQRAQKAIEAVRGQPLPESIDAYAAQSLYDTRTTAALEKFRTQEVAGIARAMKRGGLSMDDVGIYLMAKHAPERNALMAQRNPAMFAGGGGSGLTDGAAASLLAGFTPDQITALDQVATEVYAMLRRDRKRRLASGLITAAQDQAWGSMFQNYVPMRGSAEREDMDGSMMGRVGRGLDIRGKETKHALGRLSMADHPLVQAVLMAEEGIVRSEKNRVGKRILRLAQQYPNDEIWKVIGKLPDVLYLDEKTGQVKRRVDTSLLQQDRVLAVKVGGQQQYIELVDPVLATAAKNLGVQSVGTVGTLIHRIGNLLRVITRGFARLQTGANPNFFLPNIQSDFLEGALTAVGDKHRKGLVKSFVKNHPLAFKAAALHEMGRSAGPKWDAIITEWQDAGGKMDYAAFRDIDAISKEISTMLDPRGRWKRWDAPWLAVDGTLKFIERVNQPFESAARLGIYAAARDAGLSKEKAAQLSLDISGNYMRRGVATPHLSALYAFINPAIKGVEKFGRMAKNPKVLAAYAATPALSYALASMMAAAWPDDDDPEKIPLWFKITPWERSRSMIIPYGEHRDDNGNMRLDYTMFRIPHNLRPLWVLGDVIAGLQHGSYDLAEARQMVVAAIVQNFNPMGGDTVASSLAPTAIDPFVEMATNRTFGDAPIHPDEAPWNVGVPRSQNYFGRTGPMAIGLSGALNRATGGDAFNAGWVDIYPNDIEYMVRYATGGFGKFVMESADTVRNLSDGVPLNLNKTPVAKIFTGSTDQRDESSRYYTARDQVQGAQNTLRMAKKLYEKGEADPELWEQIQRQGMMLGARVEGAGKDISWKDSIPKIYTEADKLLKAMREDIQVLRKSDRPRAEVEAEIRVIEMNMEQVMRKARADHAYQAMQMQDP